jgi:hypothetical protein
MKGNFQKSNMVFHPVEGESAPVSSFSTPGHSGGIAIDQ